MNLLTIIMIACEDKIEKFDLSDLTDSELIDMKFK